MRGCQWRRVFFRLGLRGHDAMFTKGPLNRNNNNNNNKNACLKWGPGVTNPSIHKPHVEAREGGIEHQGQLETWIMVVISPDRYHLRWPGQFVTLVKKQPIGASFNVARV